MTAKKTTKEAPDQEETIEETTADIAQMTAIIPEAAQEKPEGIHERLEDLELALIAAPQEKGWAINRITILTGTLKTALPEAIKHVDDAALKADLEALLGSL